ncbi:MULTISPECIES: anaerobic C4-dicarboxylate transporter family protein [Actinomycetes]|uniref:anaerobic C4-dicarboxylate transporter family protein n=1 Tax=Actinomycetes TaxID=1760 RepID=UPI002468F0C0|nr:MULTISPECIES: anaerobic C4-dicarboxylate transporter family protein [unclassified Microbacterium]MDH5134370.1 anaerobic C4-dicarboxylate transporter family protein [Microbacterium sp. RD10]MDH5137404.1 anaerobic C4-dicarboxylate transporter family protein [Microbacterium sp. RD11]MDH5144692.1 anaerobic C4-dicarboxylate transporter family protein [Microbacterium sp. RD12]MDH5155398.1 anaerobic C4-dicarboxylate transporter family protein [Microbacterium sp. RD06]MDH5167615.1 anaerobic C4-dica
MNDSVWILVAELIVVVLAIFMGTRTSGIGLGVWGLVGVAVLVFVFGEAPGNAPVDAVFIVITVITAASTMQAAGGIDWMVSVAAKVIRKRPKSVVFLAPAMSFLFTVGAGTGNIFYPLLPVIYDVSYQQKIRPERALSVSAVASQVGILCSPVSAATASMVVLLAPQGVDLGGLLLIMWPASIAGLLVAALVMMRHGKDLEDDPEYQKRLAEGQIKPPTVDAHENKLPPTAVLSASLFLAGVAVIVFFGLFENLRPVIGTDDDGGPLRLSVTVIIEVVMGIIAALIFVFCKVKAADVPKQSTFPAGIVGAIALFGIAWLANTFVAANQTLIVDGLGSVVSGSSAFLGALLFALALFAVAMLTTSQSSATNAIVPIGITIGLPASLLVGLWPAAMGIYTLPANGSQVATVAFDQTGTTKMGKFVIDHSFQLPNLVYVGTAIVVGVALSFLFT